MQVITLSQNDFDSACFLLADKIIEDCSPVVVIGVRNGGAIVAELVCNKLHKEKIMVEFYEVKASRNLSDVKRKINIDRLFNLLPLSILNILRKVEHGMLSTALWFGVKQERNVRLNSELCNGLKQLTDGCVYIIDDAIDSGATIKSLLGEFDAINPRLNYRIGVLVVTQASPLVTPDAFIFRDVLLRFPWSSDYKHE